MSDIKHELSLQANAAAALLDNYRAIIDGDEEAAADIIEGETELLDVISAAAERLAVIGALIAGIDEHERKVKARKERLAHQHELLRTAIAVAMQQAELKKAETPVGTISRRAVPPKVHVIEEADIPAEFWVQPPPPPPKLDKKALLDALKSGACIPGASLSNGSETIQIRGA